MSCYLMDRLFVWLCSSLDKTPNYWYVYPEFKYSCNLFLIKCNKYYTKTIHNCYKFFPLPNLNSYTWKKYISRAQTGSCLFRTLFPEMLISKPLHYPVLVYILCWNLSLVQPSLTEMSLLSSLDSQRCHSFRWREHSVKIICTVINCIERELSIRFWKGSVIHVWDTGIQALKFINA